MLILLAFVIGYWLAAFARLEGNFWGLLIEPLVALLTLVLLVTLVVRGLLG